VHTVRLQPGLEVPTLECTLVDDSGAIKVVFLGRRSIPGLEPGALISVEGMVGKHRGDLAMINPRYDLLVPGAHGRVTA
jgi:RecJ-like exonuclease